MRYLFVLLAAIHVSAFGASPTLVILRPYMKGDIWEGNPFVSNHEGASAARYGASRVKGSDVIVEVDLLDVDRQRPKGDSNRNYSWRDSVRLRQESEGWLAADVYRSGSLRGLLRDYIDHECGRG